MRGSYAAVRASDRRWVQDWQDVEVLVNPNGPLVNGGPDGDNGQTGRKLVMDYYGPRVPLGGGALSGKDLTHIDRAGSYMARRLAVSAVAAGSTECLIRAAYAPNLHAPLDVSVEQSGTPFRLDDGWMRHDAIRSAFWAEHFEPARARGAHFFDEAEWNSPAEGAMVGGTS